jgi:alcohol dehydrogenase (NADP+)
MIDFDLSRRYPEVWQAMEPLVKSGKAKSIGIASITTPSNYLLPLKVP